VDVLRALPAASVHTVVCSPPYWLVRAYGTPPQRWADGWVGERGQEPTPEEYVSHAAEVFREVRRVLQADGTLWLNLGDTYWNDPGGQPGAWGQIGAKAREANRQVGRRRRAAGAAHPVLKRTDLVGVPWRVALALQADGWYVRAEVIWTKGNPLPESVRDRPTKAHEQVFLLSKRPTYYYDAEAIAEPATGGAHPRGVGLNPKSLFDGYAPHQASANVPRLHRPRANDSFAAAGRGLVARHNRRSVWAIPVGAYRGAHFATYPPALVEPCVLAGTSGAGYCPRCGAPWRRLTQREPMAKAPGSGAKRFGAGTMDGLAGTTAGAPASRTVGWRPGCACPPHAPVPCVVLDPCAGAGTTGLVADRLGRDAVLIELNGDYAELARRRIAGDAPLFADVEAAEDAGPAAGGPVSRGADGRDEAGARAAG
jgi:DNA modification methylase